MLIFLVGIITTNYNQVCNQILSFFIYIGETLNFLFKNTMRCQLNYRSLDNYYEVPLLLPFTFKPS